MDSFAEPAYAGWIGVAREDITPPIGIYARNWGAARHDVAEGIHRPLTATALALKSAPSDPPLLLIAVDLGWWRTRADEWYVRGALIEALSLDAARVVIALSHTHAGPSICREDAAKPGGDLVGPYLDAVRDAIIAASRRAVCAAAPATLTWKQGRCDLAQDRDLPDPEQPRLVCGFHPLLAVALQPDDALLVGRVTDERGAIMATLVNYACHPTTFAWENRFISPDYIGAMRVAVESGTGGAPCLFLQGASGELAPRDQYTADPAVVDRAGEHLGYAALAVLKGMLPPRTCLQYHGVVESGAPLAIWKPVESAPSTCIASLQVSVELPLKGDMLKNEVETRFTELEKSGADPVLAERLLRRMRIMESTGAGSTTAMPLWAWRIGEALLAAQSNEAYSQMQMQLRAELQPRPVIVINIANGPYCGYLPPADLYGEDLYPVWQTPYARGSLELVRDAACAALRSLV